MASMDRFVFIIAIAACYVICLSAVGAAMQDEKCTEENIQKCSAALTIATGESDASMQGEQSKKTCSLLPQTKKCAADLYPKCEERLKDALNGILAQIAPIEIQCGFVNCSEESAHKCVLNHPAEMKCGLVKSCLESVAQTCDPDSLMKKLMNRGKQNYEDLSEKSEECCNARAQIEFVCMRHRKDFKDKLVSVDKEYCKKIATAVSCVKEATSSVVCEGESHILPSSILEQAKMCASSGQGTSIDFIVSAFMVGLATFLF